MVFIVSFVPTVVLHPRDVKKTMKPATDIVLANKHGILAGSGMFTHRSTTAILIM